MVHSTRRLPDDFRLGLALLARRRWRAAAHHFQLAGRGLRRGQPAHDLCLSYQGLALVYAGDVSGLNLCRHVAARDSRQPDIYANLALAELRLRHRRRAWEALSRGLALDESHARLRQVARIMGTRRRPVVPFLRRDNPLNRWLGRATYARRRGAK